MLRTSLVFRGAEVYVKVGCHTGVCGNLEEQESRVAAEECFACSDFVTKWQRGKLTAYLFVGLRRGGSSQGETSGLKPTGRGRFDPVPAAP